MNMDTKLETINKIRKHMVCLLSEIDDICASNNLKYVLGEETAIGAYTSHDFLDNIFQVVVLMPEEDLKKFCKIVASIPERTTESFENNINYPSLSVHYVDERTTFLYGDSAFNYNNNGFYVNIRKCCHVPSNKAKAKLVNALNLVLAYVCIGELKSRSRKKRALLHCIDFVTKIFSKKLVVRILASLLGKLTNCQSKNYFYFKSFKRNVILPNSTFTSTRREEFCGSQFLVPEDQEKFIFRTYGESYEDLNLAQNDNLHLVVASDEVSYKELKENIESIKKRSRNIEKKRKKRSNLQGRISYYRRIINGYWDYLFATKERYYFYKRFLPVKDIIIEHYESNDLNWLNKVMEDYIQVIDEYTEKNVTVSIDSELDRIVIELLSNNGNKELAQKYSKLVEKVNVKPISIDITSDMKNNSMEWISSISI